METVISIYKPMQTISRVTRVLTIVLTSSLLCSALKAADEATEKNYSLFNPVPQELLRPLQSEEFDKVMNPFTVDEGHFQLETDLVEWYSSWGHKTATGPILLPGGFGGIPPSPQRHLYSSQSFAWYPAFKFGLWNNLDFEVSPSYTAQYNRYTSGFGQFNNHSDNFGRVTAAAKINLWGNDTGQTAFALKPYFTIPTHGGDLLGGMEAALAIRLPWKMMLKVSSGLEAIENNYTVYGQFANRLTIEKTFGQKTTVFVNLNGLVTSKSSQDWWGYTGADAGYNVTKNFQVYAAMRFGLESAYDYDPYVGITWKY
jgi:hypothetical protein